MLFNFRFPKHGYFGILFILVCWPLNWILPGLRTHILFFPLWLGYVLVVDAMVYARTKESILTKSFRNFALMFLLSAPTWWLFELFNLRTENWQYLGRELFSDFEYGFYTTLNFSIVIPAVLSTASLINSFKWPHHFKNSAKIAITRKKIIFLFILGFTMLGLLLTWPTYFYPFIWSGLLFLLEPINYLRGKKSLLSRVKQGDWSVVIMLFAGTLICGFFWELWNFYSYPKWIYNTPFVNYWHIFEMPLLGYLGYLPFGLELYALYHLIMPKKFELTI